MGAVVGLGTGEVERDAGDGGPDRFPLGDLLRFVGGSAPSPSTPDASGTASVDGEAAFSFVAVSVPSRNAAGSSCTSFSLKANPSSSTSAFLFSFSFPSFASPSSSDFSFSFPFARFLRGSSLPTSPSAPSSPPSFSSSPSSSPFFLFFPRALAVARLRGARLLLGRGDLLPLRAFSFSCSVSSSSAKDKLLGTCPTKRDLIHKYNLPSTSAGS